MTNKGKWYVVWVGTEPGICETWEECQQRVTNFPNAKYKSFRTQAEAVKAYRDGCENDELSILRTIAKGPEQKVNYSAITEIVPGSIAVDAACSGNPGKMEYRGVDIDTGRQLFIQGPFDQGTNNIGEFLALVHGLAMLAKEGRPHTTIYSDSVTAMAWVRDRKCKTKIQVADCNANLFAIVRRAEAWIQTHQFTNPIVKWNTKEWGEIPADFGRK